jgi:hypothetical protein
VLMTTFGDAANMELLRRQLSSCRTELTLAGWFACVAWHDPRIDGLNGHRANFVIALSAATWPYERAGPRFIRSMRLSCDGLITCLSASSMSPVERGVSGAILSSNAGGF